MWSVLVVATVLISVLVAARHALARPARAAEPRHPDGQPMTKREAQVYRMIQKVLDRNWRAIKKLRRDESLDLMINYHRMIWIHISGSGQCTHRSGFGEWEAIFMPDGTLSVPRKIAQP